MSWLPITVGPTTRGQYLFVLGLLSLCNLLKRSSLLAPSASELHENYILLVAPAKYANPGNQHANSEVTRSRKSKHSFSLVQLTA